MTQSARDYYVEKKKRKDRLEKAAPLLLEACEFAHRLLLQIGDESDYCTRTINDLEAALKAAKGE